MSLKQSEANEIAQKCADNIFKEMEAMDKIGQVWSHHPNNFLPADVTTDQYGMRRFKDTLKEIVRKEIWPHCEIGTSRY